MIKNSKFKKSLLTLGSIAAVASPIAAVVSCSDHEDLRRDIINPGADVTPSLSFIKGSALISVDAPAWSDESVSKLVADPAHSGFYMVKADGWLDGTGANAPINRVLYKDIQATARFIAQEIITNPAFKEVKNIKGAIISVKRTGHTNYRIKLGAFMDDPRNIPLLSLGDLFNQPYADKKLFEFGVDKLQWGVEFKFATEGHAAQKWQDILSGRLSRLARQH